MRPFERDDLGRFALIHGPNEQGKTLLIDALTRLLFKRELKKSYQRQFGSKLRNMGRVREDPEGFVVVESRGVEHKLGSKDTISSVFPVPVSPEDFRNVFFVRDSDLTLNAEHDYYARVTEKLTGLRSSEINSLLRGVQKRGRLRSVSPDSDLSNNIEHQKVASRVDEAAAMVTEIDSLKRSLSEDGYDELEAELAEARERLVKLEDDADVFREAEKHKQIKKARRILNEYRRMAKTLERLENLNPDELKKWQTCELKRERLEADRRADEKELLRIEKAARLARKEVDQHSIETKKAEDRLRRIESELKPQIDSYQYERAERSRALPQSGIYKRGAIAFAAAFVLTLAAYLVYPSNLLAGVAGVALMAGLFNGVILLRYRRAEGNLRAMMENLDAEGRRFGVEVESVNDLQSRVGDIETAVRSLEQELLTKKAAVEDFEKEKTRLENRVRSYDDNIVEINAEVKVLKARTQMDSTADFQSAIDRRTKLAAAAAAKQDILRNILPTEAQGNTAVDEWQSMIDSHLRAVDEEQMIEYDADAVSALNDELQALKKRRAQIEADLEEGKRKLHSIEVRVGSLNVVDSPPPCRTTKELEHLGRLIRDYVERVERDRRTAQEAIRIFQGIDAEKKSKVSDLFGLDSPVSEHIRVITGGRYTRADFDLDKNEVFLTSAEEDRVPANYLSGGAFDQLYLAVRLSIAERLLAEEKGFFVLDDPFVKADADRLANMMEMLKRLVAEGWQIIYFSAKREIADILRGDVENGDVQLIQLEKEPADPSETGNMGSMELFD